MNSILVAAIGGAIGGALGGLIGAGIDRLRGKRSQISLYITVALAVAGGSVGRLMAPEPSIEGQLEAAGPMFQTIHKYYPDVFALMVSDLKSADLHDPIALQNKVRPRLSALVAAHRTQMDDSTTAELGKLMLDETAVLAAKSPQSCVGVLTGGQTTVDMRTVYTPDLVKRDADVTARLIQQVATRPASPAGKFTDAESQALVVAAMKQLSAADQALITPLLAQQKTASTPDEARVECAFYRDFFTAAVNAPAGTLRRLLSS